MDKATLVRSDQEIEGRVLKALSDARIPITLCQWNYVPQLEEWQLIIATPWYDSKGPHEAYSAIVKALQAEGSYQDVPMRRLFVKSPEDTLVQTLQAETKDRREGAIHILGGNGQSHKREYAVLFAPFVGPGGAVPARHLSGVEELRQFLEKGLHIRRSSVEEALADLSRQGSASIFNVQLSLREAKRMGLA